MAKVTELKPGIGRTYRRRRRVKPEAEIVLLCNPRAGGRWKELADILDSEEAAFVRRIVTDSVEDVADALHTLTETKLLCVYGGDGTIQRVLDHLISEQHEIPQLALLGGGTMNVTSRWCGFGRNPGRNFRQVIRAYRSGDVLSKELPLLEVRTGREVHYGFTFGMGPIVRLLDSYERGRKGKVAAVGTAARAMAAVWLGGVGGYQEVLAQMPAEVDLDGERLPHDRFACLFANVTGQINPGVEPFVSERERESFYVAAYAIGAREMTMALPFLARGLLPIDVSALFSPSTFLERERGAPSLPKDPRYINSTGATLHVRTDERIYTLDGEILPTIGDEISVSLGTHLKLVVGPGTTVRQTIRLAKHAVKR